MLSAKRRGFVSDSARDLHQIQQALNRDAAIGYRILADKKVGKGTQQ